MTKSDSVLDRLRLGWINLAGSDPAEAGATRVQRLSIRSPEGPDVVLRLSLLPDHRRGILLETAYTPDMADYATRSIEILDHPVEIDGRTRSLLHIRCAQARLNEVFALVATGIVQRLHDGEAAAAAVAAAIAEFQELLQSIRPRKLTREQALGLFGELTILRQLSDIDPEAVRLWIGPLAEPRDFRSMHGALEVKTTVDRDFSAIEISSLEQLDTSAEKNLYLAAIAVEANDSAGDSLADLVDAISAAGVSSEVFWQLLAEAGYDDEVQRRGDAPRFCVVEQRLYRVEDGFPRLVRSTFAGGTPPDGVRGIRYRVDLSHAGTFRIDPADRALAAFVRGA